jgi:hypothetical protein
VKKNSDIRSRSCGLNWWLHRLHTKLGCTGYVPIFIRYIDLVSSSEIFPAYTRYKMDNVESRQLQGTRGCRPSSTVDVGYMRLSEWHHLLIDSYLY